MEPLIFIMLLISAAIVPTVIFFAGWILEGLVPSTPNRIVGYRSKLSMRSEDTWNYANALCGRLWKRLSWMLLAGSMAAVLIAAAVIWSRSTLQESSSGIIWTILSVAAAQILAVLLSIRSVEKRLRQDFLPDGTRAAGAK